MHLQYGGKVTKVVLAKDGTDGFLQCYGMQFGVMICDVFLPRQTWNWLHQSALEFSIVCTLGGGSYRGVTGVKAAQTYRSGDKSQQ